MKNKKFVFSVLLLLTFILSCVPIFANETSQSFVPNNVSYLVEVNSNTDGSKWAAIYPVDPNTTFTIKFPSSAFSDLVNCNINYDVMSDNEPFIESQASEFSFIFTSSSTSPVMFYNWGQANVTYTITQYLTVPSAPSYLVVSGNTLSWSSITDATYQIMYSQSASNLIGVQTYTSSSNYFNLSNLGYYRVRATYNGSDYGDWSNWVSYVPTGSQLSAPTWTVVPQFNNVYRVGYVENATAYRIYCNGYVIKVVQPSEFITILGNTYYDYAALSNGYYQVQALGNGSTYSDSALTTKFYFNTTQNSQLPTVPVDYEYDSDKSTSDNIFGLLQAILDSIINIFDTVLYYIGIVFQNMSLWISNLLLYVTNFMSVVPNLLGFLPNEIQSILVAFIGLSLFFALWHLFAKH